MFESVKESTDVTVEHPVHFAPHDPKRKRIQGMVRASVSSKPIGEPYKVLLVERVKHLHRGALNNLIFQHRHSERPKLTRLAHLGDVRPTHRLGSIGSSLESLREILKIPLQLLSVVPPRLAVDPWSSFAPEREVCRTQPLNVINVVQERCEPLSLIPPCCLTYPLKRAGHAWPALSPGHVTLKQIPLGQPPSVHRLLGLRLSFVRRLCSYFRSAALFVLWSCPTSRVRASSACVLRLPAAVWGFLFPRQTQDLPVPAQGAYVYAQGLRPRGAHKRLAISTLPVFPSAYFDSVGTPE